VNDPSERGAKAYMLALDVVGFRGIVHGNSHGEEETRAPSSHRLEIGRSAPGELGERMRKYSCAFA
jgi:hypothetical protein